MAPNSKIWRDAASLIVTAKSVFSQHKLFNYKLLCLKRSSKSKFMPDTYVFPGGVVSKSDSNASWLKLYEKFGFNKGSFDSLKPVENDPQIFQDGSPVPKHLSFRICAIRETFEECGILLCKNPKINSDINSNWASFVGGPELIKWQHKVHDDANEFINLCAHFDIYPDVWALKNWSFWKTPSSLPSKFNTVFYIATLSQMPVATSDEKEIQDVMWTTPDECISLNKQESVLLPPPQFYEISRLRNMSDIETVSKFASDRSKYGFETYFPLRIKTDEGICTVLPGKPMDRKIHLVGMRISENWSNESIYCTGPSPTKCDDLYSDEEDKHTSEPLYMPQLPDSRTKNRILHSFQYSKNQLLVQNVTSKSNHLTPYASSSL